MKLTDHFDQFLQEREHYKNVALRTLDSYECAWKAFAPFIADAKSEEQLRSKLKFAVMEMRKRKATDTRRALSIVSINNYIRHMNAFTAWMLAEKIITEPARIDKMKEPTVIRQILSDDECRAFIRFKPTNTNERRVHMMGLVVLDTGLRLDEVRSLKRRDIRFDGFPLIRVVHGKGDKERFVPFARELRKPLFKWVVKLNGDDALFGTRNASLLSKRNADRDLRAIGVKLGIKLAFHKMRHTFATNYYKLSRDLVALQRILGHAHISTTMIYLHMQTADLTEHNESRSLLNALRTA